LLLIPMIFTSSGNTSDDVVSAENTISDVRIGLKYSTSAVNEYGFTTEYGLEYGVQNKNSHEFISVGSSLENLSL
jgi:hypothetical protein